MMTKALQFRHWKRRSFLMKFQIANSKFQTSSDPAKAGPISNDRNETFEFGSLGFVWDLVLGVWCFMAQLTPRFVVPRLTV